MTGEDAGPPNLGSSDFYSMFVNTLWLPFGIW